MGGLFGGQTPMKVACAALIEIGCFALKSLALMSLALCLPGCGTAVGVDGRVDVDTLAETTTTEEVVDLFVVYCDNQWGAIDKSGHLVLDMQGRGLGGFADGLASVSVGFGEPVNINGRIHYKGGYLYGYVDRTGRTVIEPVFDAACTFSEGLAAVALDEKWGFIDTSGNLVVPFQFEEPGSFSEGLAPVATEWFGFIDRTGKFVIEPEYAWAESFSEGLAAVNTSQGYGFIDKTGESVIEPQFDDVGAFGDGLAPVWRPPTGDEEFGEWGFIDRSGQLVIPARFQQALEFSSGLAPVSMVTDPNQATGGEWYFIDRAGASVLGPYMYADSFRGGLAWVTTLEGRNAYIDTVGTVVWMEP
ncbi:MAG: WG repeat-containing protein [Thermoleophilia bacterium]|nr:WG repeat-containing protein [Thermoleophilia bacterium]